MGVSAREFAELLNEWFRNISHIADERFGMAPPGPHREAVIRDVLRSNAKILFESELDRKGKLYTPLCFFLAAACRVLKVSLGVGHWRAALDNVVQLHEQLDQARAESAVVGLEVGSPAELFKQQLVEAIDQAGLTYRNSYLDKQSRDVALGLATNWGMRFLLAYSLESTHSKRHSNRRDRTWIANHVESLLDSTRRQRA